MKRFLCALAVAALLLFCVSCGNRVVEASTQSVATAAPTASSSRNVRSESVAVSETVADADHVSGTQTPQTSDAGQAEVDTPSTGDIPVAYIAAVLGLILICSAGLVMLKRL
ncbi:MAG: hypothetical protein U0L91_07005 [Gemmiger sp.]|uniref:hypothetical protein n=1 Tax=Gemmiger sp. TaxID=2049027 RepID=UPI002E761650|nr:hypothetical protein [Gemmiger sp.]MEE0801011.1 hypothetical protein [Gemmiger sp.]